MANPVPISRLRAAPSLIRFPSHVVTTSVVTRVPATRAIVPDAQRRDRAEGDREAEQDDADPQQPLGHRPRAPASPPAAAGRCSPATMPRATAQVRTPIAGTSRWASIAPPRPSAAATEPRPAPGASAPRGPRRGPTASCRGAHGAVALDHGHAGTSCETARDAGSGRGHRRRLQLRDQVDRLAATRRTRRPGSGGRRRPASAPGCPRRRQAPAAAPGCPAGRRCSPRGCSGRAAAGAGSAASRARGARRWRGTPAAARRRRPAASPAARPTTRVRLYVRRPVHGHQDTGAVGHEDHRPATSSTIWSSSVTRACRLGSVRPSGGTVRAPGSDAASRVCQWSSTWPRRPGTRTTVASLIGSTAGRR